MPRPVWPWIALALALAIFLALPFPFLQKLMGIGYGLDPQRPAHTYFIGGAPMPIEARKAGMYGGFILTWLYLIARGRARATGFPPWPVSLALVAGVGLMGLDGLNATLYDLRLPVPYTPQLPLRLSTGLLTGIAFAGFLLPVLNTTLWRARDPRPILAGWHDWIATLALCAGFFLAIVNDLPPLLYPLSVLSVAGIPGVLLIINLVVLVSLLRREASFDHLAQVMPLVVVALTLVAAELGGMSLLRWALMNHLGITSFEAIP